MKCGSFSFSQSDFFNAELLRPSLLLSHVLQAAILPIDSAIARVAFFAFDLLGLATFTARGATQVFNWTARAAGNIATLGLSEKFPRLRRAVPIIGACLLIGAATHAATFAYAYFASWAIRGLIVGAYQAVRILAVRHQFIHITSQLLGISELESKAGSKKEKKEIRERAEQIMIVATCLFQLGLLAVGFAPIAAAALGAPVMLLVYSLAYRTLLARSPNKEPILE